MKVRILGCGTAGGVPVVGNEWGLCDPKNPKNQRLRSSVLLQTPAATVLIDSSPDVRQQLLAAEVAWVDGVFYTHIHADHVHGINDVMFLTRYHKRSIDVYGDAKTLTDIQKSFSYLFHNANPKAELYNFFVTPHVISGDFMYKDLKVTPFEQNHGFTTSLGFRIGDFAYSTDVKALDEAAFQALKGVRVWVVDCMGMMPHETHSHLEQTLGWIRRVKPEKAYLTHMGLALDYDALSALLPAGVEPCYDGLTFQV